MTTADPTPQPADHTTRPEEPVVYVLGGGALGAAVASRLRAAERDVVLVDESADSPDVEAHQAAPTDALALAEAGLDGDSVVVVATSSDSQNLLAAQLVRARFGVERVVVLTNHPGRNEAMAAAGHDAVCATAALADVLVDRL